MRRMWKKAPGLVRWLLVTLVILAVVGVGAWAYTALTGTGEVTVVEPLSFVGPSSFTVSLYPQETETATLTVANASSVALDVDLVSVVTPDPGPKGMTIDIPNSITVAAEGQIVVNIDISPGKSAEPGVYNVSIEFAR